jgi:hypothetical protein
MIRTVLIRLGGLVAMVSGVLFAVAELLDLPDGVGGRVYYGLLPGGGSLFYNALLVGAMAEVAAIAVLHASRRDRDGIRGLLVSGVAFIGLALMLWGELGEPVAAVLGLLVGSLGVLMLGGVTISMGVHGLPRWCGAALMVWGLALILWLLLPGVGVLGPPFPVSLGGGVVGVSWTVAGFGVFLAAGRRTEQASRIR